MQYKQLRQNYKMLEQQNLMVECSDQAQNFSAPIINRIEHESTRFKNLVMQLRLNKKKSNGEYTYTPFQIQNQSQISNIQPISQKLDRNSFQLDLPNDIPTRRNTYTMVPNSKDKYSGKQGGDQGLKYRPRGSVNGRDDIRIRNLNQIHKKIVGQGQKRRIQNNSTPKQILNLQSALSKLDQLQNPQQNHRKPYLSNSKAKFNISTPKTKINSNNTSPRRNSNNEYITRNSDISGSKVRKFEISNKNFVQIQGKQLMSYLKKQKDTTFPTHDAQPTKLYEFFINLCTNFGLGNQFNEPLIKRYRNCIYFGQKVPQHQNYIGFVWYFRKALYYGQFQKGRKHGYGVEIDLEDQNNECIWRGTFTNGKKTGYFQLTSTKMEYHGSLVNSYFDGEGMLKIKGYSVYKGTFQAGMKHGFGVQNFQNKKLLNYKGEYFENKFEGSGQLEGPNYYYKGTFRNNKAHGNGFERTDEFEYEGQFKQGKKQGRGIIKMKNGQQFQGIFQNGNITKQITFGNEKSSSKKQPQTKKIQAIQTAPVRNQYQKQSQYSKSIKIQGFSRNQEEDSLVPSTVLPQQSSMKIPNHVTNKKKPQSQEQQTQQNFIKYNQNLISKKYLDSIQNNSPTNINPNFKANIDIKTYSSRIVPLQKNLSKRLNSLLEQNQNQQATIQATSRRPQLPTNFGLFKIHEVENNQNAYPQRSPNHKKIGYLNTYIHTSQFVTNSSHNLGYLNKVPFDSHVSRIQARNNNEHENYERCQTNSDGEEEPLQIKLLPRQ